MLENSHIEKIAGGDRAAFEKLHKELYPRLFYYVFKLIRNKEQAEDFIQEAFVMYWQHRTDFQQVLAVKTYFYLILRNKVAAHIRDNSIHRRILENMPAEEATDEQTAFWVSEVCGEVQRAVATLSPQTQRVIRLSMQDLTVEQIAQAMNVSPNTVKTLKKNAYKLLREQLGHLRHFLFFLLFY